MKIGFKALVAGVAALVLFIVAYSNWVEREFTIITHETHVAPATEPGEPIALPPAHSGGVQVSSTKPCKLQFVKYISSEWEKQWAKNADK
jgi:hypothetical protein